MDEIQKELDEIDASVLADEIPPELANFEKTIDFMKYRPGLLTEWDLELNRLIPNDTNHTNHKAQDIDLAIFDAHFNDAPGDDDNRARLTMNEK